MRGKEARDVLSTTDITEEERTNPETILNKFNNYFIPKTNKSVERHRFNSRLQLPGETFDTFVSELRRIMQNCDFGAMRDDLLTDRIVCGIRDPKIKDRLLREQNLDLAKAVNICKSAEQTEIHIKNLHNQNSVEVGAISNQRMNSSNNARYPRNTDEGERKTENRWSAERKEGQEQRRSSMRKASNERQGECKRQETDKGNRQCTRCGYLHAVPGKCPAMGKQCKICQKQNHFASQCRSNKNVNVVVNENSDNREYTLGIIRDNFEISTNDNDLWLEILIVNCKRNIQFKLDTGAQVNVIPYHIFSKLNLNNLLKKSSLNITNYGVQG